MEQKKTLELYGKRIMINNYLVILGTVIYKVSKRASKSRNTDICNGRYFVTFRQLNWTKLKNYKNEFELSVSPKQDSDVN